MWQPFEDELEEDPNWTAPKEKPLDIIKLTTFVLGAFVFVLLLAKIASL